MDNCQMVNIPNFDQLLVDFHKHDPNWSVPKHFEKSLEKLRTSHVLDSLSDILPEPSLGEDFEMLLCFYHWNNQHIGTTELRICLEPGEIWLNVYEYCYGEKSKTIHFFIHYPDPDSEGVEDDHEDDTIWCESEESAFAELEKRVRDTYALLTVPKQ